MSWLKKIPNKYHFSLTEDQRLIWLSNIGIVGLLFSLLFSFNAWSTSRTYPLSPVFEGFALAGEIQNLLFVLAIIALGFSLMNSKFKDIAVSLGLISLIILVFLDIARLQPWLLHYFGILILFSLVITKKQSDSILLDVARIITVGIYFWSGIHKINTRFFSEIFPWFTEQLWSPFGEIGLHIFITLGLLVPFIEISFALGLLTKRFRKISFFGSALMLFVVLASLGPAGQNWNSSIWPWNIAIFAMVVVLFYGTDFDFHSFLNRLKKNTLAWIAIVIFWIMPAGNFVGLTDHYLAWSLYSGQVPEAALFGDQLFLESLSLTANDGELRFARWAQAELNLVPYPENRVFQNIFETVCKNNPEEPLTLIINNYSLTSSQPAFQKTFKCNPG